jgi:hypothetical protein
MDDLVTASKSVWGVVEEGSLRTVQTPTVASYFKVVRLSVQFSMVGVILLCTALFFLNDFFTTPPKDDSAASTRAGQRSIPYTRASA